MELEHTLKLADKDQSKRALESMLKIDTQVLTSSTKLKVQEFEGETYKMTSLGSI